MAETQAIWQEIKTEANRLGFNPVGVAPALPVPHLITFENWVQAGRHADMGYLSRPDTLAKRRDPQQILEGCRRIICLAMPYQRPQAELKPSPSGTGRISNYARTRDYHEIIWEKLALLEDFIHRQCKRPAQLKSYVDTGPILERSYAAHAGIGIAGKNSCLLIQGAGSYFFLAEILTDLDLPLTVPFTRDLCGTCRRCIDACPTNCIREDRTLDAGRCISYLTVENKGPIPNGLKEKIGSWVFGCDVCQIVCPHNAWTPEQRLPLGEMLLPEFIDLIALLKMDRDSFNSVFGETPVSRAKHQGMLRNAAIVLGNQRCMEALPALRQNLARESEPAVQDACRWAIGKIEGQEKDPRLISPKDE
jgi:epoxyqueuosine reductase